jgi:hypothetical protein
MIKVLKHSPYNLTIVNCIDIKDNHLTLLNNINTLTLITCNELFNLSNLKVDKLVLNECSNISVLPSEVRDMTLINCQIESISLLYNSKKITVHGCTQLIEYSPLLSVKELTIRDSYLTHFKLDHLRYCSLSECYNLCNVSFLNGINTVILDNCHKITDISCLNLVDNLDIHNCNGLVSVNGFTGNSTISISDCKNITCISDFDNIKSIFIYDCPNIENIYNLKNIKNLTLSYLYKFALDNIKNVNNISITNCYQIIV